MDQNQPEIVEALRRVGAKVQHLSTIGGGCPDLLVATPRKTCLLEIKMPGETINKLQAEFIATWPGELHVVRSVEEAVRAVVGEEAMK